MFSKSKLFIALAIYCGIGHISALEDGDFYKITLSSNGKVQKYMFPFFLQNYSEFILFNTNRYWPLEVMALWMELI